MCIYIIYTYICNDICCIMHTLNYNSLTSQKSRDKWEIKNVKGLYTYKVILRKKMGLGDIETWVLTAGAHAHLVASLLPDHGVFHHTSIKALAVFCLVLAVSSGSTQ